VEELTKVDNVLMAKAESPSERQRLRHTDSFSSVHRSPFRRKPVAFHLQQRSRYNYRKEPMVSDTYKQKKDGKRKREGEKRIHSAFCVNKSKSM
jgi:hypothetical protein